MKKKHVPRPSFLRSATPYPWRRNHKGDLCGARGQPIYFRGTDAVLVEHSPDMAEALVIIRALCGSRRHPDCALQSIQSVAAHILAKIQRRADDPSWCKGSIT
jgi:hypothetical protein